MYTKVKLLIRLHKCVLSPYGSWGSLFTLLVSYPKKKPRSERDFFPVQESTKPTESESKGEVWKLNWFRFFMNLHLLLEISTWFFSEFSWHLTTSFFPSNSGWEKKLNFFRTKKKDVVRMPCGGQLDEHVFVVKNTNWGDSWMYPYQRTPMGNPDISPI